MGMDGDNIPWCCDSLKMISCPNKHYISASLSLIYDSRIHFLLVYGDCDKSSDRSGVGMYLFMVNIPKRTEYIYFQRLNRTNSQIPKSAAENFNMIKVFLNSL